MNLGTNLEIGKDKKIENLPDSELNNVALSRRSSRRASISRANRIQSDVGETNNSVELESLSKDKTSLKPTKGKKYQLKKNASISASDTLLQKIKNTDKGIKKSISAMSVNHNASLDGTREEITIHRHNRPKKLNISHSNMDDINQELKARKKEYTSANDEYVSDSNLSLRKKKKAKSTKSEEFLTKKKNGNGSEVDNLTTPLQSPLIINALNHLDVGDRLNEMEKRLEEITADTLATTETAKFGDDMLKKKRKKKSVKSNQEKNVSTSNLPQTLTDKDILPAQQKESAASSTATLDKPYEDSILSINVIKTNSLVSELNLKHPLVQIHILDATTGMYLSKSQHNRLVTSSREPAHLTYILPTITKTFNMLENETKTPVWNHKVVLNEKYYHIVDAKVIIFFEILDFVNNLKAIRKYPDGWNRIAWGFLKPIASNGNPTTNQEARLQLYKYPWRLFPFTPRKFPIPFVYTCYKQAWRKYPSTLYVKIGAHKPLEPSTTLDRPTLPTELESGKTSLDQLLGKMKLMNLQDNGMKNMLSLTSVKPKWRRKPGDFCKLPNRVLYRIDAGQKGSFSCCFSNKGYLLAIAGVDQNSYPIKIYKIDTGERIATLEGHQDLIYQLNWFQDDSQLISASSDGSTRIWSFGSDGGVRQTSILLHPTFVYTALFHPTKKDPRIAVTGSYDGAIRFWDSRPNEGIIQTNSPVLKLVGHKSNINSLCFDTDGSRLYSGDGSGIIKIWSNESIDGQKHSLNYECIKTVDALKGHPIQALRMHPSNRKLMAQTIGPNLHMLDTRIHRILTHFQLPLSKKFELESSLPAAQTYPKLFNSVINDATTTKQQLNSIHQISSARFLKCSFSACGSFIFVGSTNGSVHFWRSESGAYLGTYNHQTLSSWAQGNYPVVDISFHPHDHMIAFAIWGDKEPVRVYTWDKKQKDIKTLEEREDVASQYGQHLNVERLVSSSMADFFPVGIKTSNNWMKTSKSPGKEIPSDMIALISPSSIQ